MPKSKHPDHCPNYRGSLKSLAHEINDMAHNSRGELFGYLHELSKKQTSVKQERDKVSYVEGLTNVQEGLQQIVSGESKCWEVCEPHTEIIHRLNG